MLAKVEIFTIGIPLIDMGGVSWVSQEGHVHDYVGNWLWDDGGCILWDDGSVIAL